MNFENIENTEYFPQADLSSRTTFRLKSIGDLVIVKTIPALKMLISKLRLENKPYRLIGWGANQVLPPGPREIFIQLDFNLDPSYLDTAREEYILPASVGLNQLTAHAIKFCLKGWEVFTGIPASLGGAIIMNAGTNLGEIGSLIKEVQILRANGDEENIVITPHSFSYRQNHFVRKGDIVIGAKMIHQGIDPAIPHKIQDYLQMRKRTQPLSSKNCGCVFKNISPQLPAGYLVDILGLKGLSYRDLMISSKHGNFIENKGQATADDFFHLINFIQNQVRLHLGIEFELEVKID